MHLQLPCRLRKISIAHAQDIEDVLQFYCMRTSNEVIIGPAIEQRTLDAFRYGVAAGSAAVLNPGTELSKQADVERLCKVIAVVPL
jgi:hypothetical protein